jgi:IclR family acetate operon transcriptional repressor
VTPRTRSQAAAPHTASSRYTIRVLAKALDVLEVLVGESGGLELTELARRLNMPKSSAFRSLVTLEQRGYVERAPESDRFRLGVKLFELGSAVAANFDVRDVARPLMQYLRERFHETVNLGVLHDGLVVYLDIVESTRSIRMAAQPGRHDMAHSTSLGKALLAHLTDQEVEAIVGRHGLQAFTPRTVTTLRALKAELRRVRERGYSMDDIENEPGVRCVGASILNHQGRAVAAISVSGPADRMTHERVDAIAAELVIGTRQISQRLGYKEPSRGALANGLPASQTKRHSRGAA